MDSESQKIKKDEEFIKFWNYGSANFNDNKIIVLKEPSDNSFTIEDNSVSNPIYFDQIIIISDKRYISYITISGKRRYSLIEDKESIIIIIFPMFFKMIKHQFNFLIKMIICGKFLEFINIII